MIAPWRSYVRQGRSAPLRRTSDVLEAWASLVLGAVLFLGAPAAGLAAGWTVYTEGRATVAEQTATRHRVHAVLAKDAPPPNPSADGTTDDAKYPVAVRWSDPGGSREAVAPVPAGLKRGDPVDVWLDDRGRGTEAPAAVEDVWLNTVAAGSGAAAIAAVSAAGLRLAVRRTADRHRMTEWEREWARTEPVWSGRRN
ncbi:hypothetical protein [Streptomyces sp. NPDC059165]|uniref:Rv1733c family protein n=1 Tax=Streptomyces sp. NPDC059165 TaxID=3346751 RepID=UPI0036BBC033